MKDWVTQITNQQVAIAQDIQRQYFNKQLALVKDEFLVPDIIGPFTNLMKS